MVVLFCVHAIDLHGLMPIDTMGDYNCIRFSLLY